MAHKKKKIIKVTKIFWKTWWVLQSIAFFKLNLTTSDLDGVDN